MKKAETSTRGPPQPYVIDGQTYYNIQQAAPLIGVSQPTLSLWARQGAAPFGFLLNIRKEPFIYDPRRLHKETKSHRAFRAIIPELTIRVLKATLQEHPVRRGGFERNRAAIMLATAERYRRQFLCDSPDH
jgi:hypothetical protein